MRKVTQVTSENFMDSIACKVSNTAVKIEDGITKLLLFGNCIAELNGKKLTIRNCGWSSPTTKERLNGVLSAFYTGYSISQKAGQWYMDSTPWDGKDFTINI